MKRSAAFVIGSIFLWGGGTFAFEAADLETLELGHGCPGCDLSQADLAWGSMVNLKGANLEGANLSGARLELGDLTRAGLRGANLSGAQSNEAVYERANLRGAVMDAASFEQSNFTKAWLSSASMKGADFSDANFQDAILDGADMRAADLNNAEFTDADLNGVNLDGADLSHASLERAMLDVEVKIVIVVTPEGEEHRPIIIPANLNNANLNWVNLSDAYLGGAILDGASMTNAFLRRTVLRDASLTGADLSGATIDGADISGADLRGAQVWEVKGLSTLTWGQLPLGIAQIREELKRAGARDLERELTYAIKHAERINTGGISAAFNYVLFEVTSDYGMSPGRPLIIILVIVVVCAFPYMSSVIDPRPLKSGIWRVWPSDRVHKESGQEQPQRVSVSGLWVPLWGLYFSLVSAFHLGWRDLNVGNWIARINPKEYTLRATGWVKVVSGIQSLLSVYLLALWALSYFGRPFE